MIRSVIVIASLGLLVAGCKTTGLGSVENGECRIFERPPYIVLGKQTYDQDWIDSQVEGGVGGCQWKRPAPRPAALDAAPGRKSMSVRKRSVIQRIKDRVTGAKPAPAPVPAVAAPVEPDIAESKPAPPPRDRIDHLLHPNAHD